MLLIYDPATVNYTLQCNLGMKAKPDKICFNLFFVVCEYVSCIQYIIIICMCNKKYIAFSGKWVGGFNNRVAEISHIGSFNWAKEKKKPDL